MSKPLRILTVADVPPDPNSGAAGTVWHTNVALRELGHTVDEIWKDQLGPQRIAHGNLHSLLEQPRAYRREVKKAVARSDYDVIQMSQPQAWLASKYLKQSGYRGIVINRSHGLELRVDAVLPNWHRKLGVLESRFPRSLMTPLLRRYLQRQWHQVVTWGDGIILTNEMDREFLLENTSADPSQLSVIHHGVPTEFISREYAGENPDRLKKLLYVGQFSFIKGYHIMVDVMNQTLKQEPSFQMTWVTAASAHEQIRGMLDDTIRDRVTLLPWCDQKELIELYDQHGLFVFPSFFEGAGKAALEAMSRGLCVIASDTGGMHDYIQHGINGFLCEVGNVRQFVERLNQLLNSPETIRATGTQAYESMNDYSWKKCAEKAVEFYRTLQKTE